MKKKEKPAEFYYQTALYIREKFDPLAEVPILSEEEIDLVVDRLHERLERMKREEWELKR
jgi:hypothetical protein